MTRYTTPGKLPAASAVPSSCPRARLHVRNVRAPPRRSLFRSSSDGVLYDPLNEVRQHSEANACEAAGP